LTDRQTDRILIARPHLHSMQSGKNAVICREGSSRTREFQFSRLMIPCTRCSNGWSVN